MSWNLAVDVVVIGSGGAGLAAALSASDAGASVAVIEKTDKFGGTTAVSGGIAWIPNNNHMHEVGSTDSRDEALTYLRGLSLDKIDPELLEAFVDTGPRVIRFLEERTPIRFRALKYPDYHPEFPGGKRGRSLDPELFDEHQLGDLVPALRLSAHQPGPIAITDVEAGVSLLDFNLIAERMEKGLRAGGNALIGGMLKACVDRGIDLRRNARASSLVLDNGAVVGVMADHNGGQLSLGARRGVILASGGFEWNPELCRQFLRGPLECAISPPINEGDGLLMAMEIGAALGNMAEAWWHPAICIPGEEYDGRQLYRLTLAERTLPGTIMVNRRGQRFVNEAHNYNDVGRAFHAFDPVAFDYPNLPAWFIFDHAFRLQYPVMTVFPGDPTPSWLPQADTLRQLASAHGIDPDGLEETVHRFNRSAAVGKDPEFHRGESFYDRHNGDQRREGALATLAPIETPPFYALRVYSGALGTKGGPKTDARARVLNVHSAAIPGLYAAGNAMAGVTGMAYGGAGGTIGPALTFGYIAGVNAAAEPARF